MLLKTITDELQNRNFRNRYTCKTFSLQCSTLQIMLPGAKTLHEIFHLKLRVILSLPGTSLLKQFQVETI